VAAVISARSASPAPSSSWKHFLESAGGAALITVAIGGLFGTVLTAMIQVGLREREFQQSWLKSRGDQALVAYKEYLDGELNIVQKAFEAIGKTVAAADNLVILTHPQFDPAAYADEPRKALIAQKSLHRHEFNLAQADWRRTRRVLGFLIAYYHPRSDVIRRRWLAAEQTVEALTTCAERWYLDHAVQYSTTEPCVAERRELDAKLTELSAEFQTGLHYAWEGWESPAQLRHSLEAGVTTQLTTVPKIRP
jgi:hypothetical protein